MSEQNEQSKKNVLNEDTPKKIVKMDKKESGKSRTEKLPRE